MSWYVPAHGSLNPQETWRGKRNALLVWSVGTGWRNSRMKPRIFHPPLLRGKVRCLPKSDPIQFQVACLRTAWTFLTSIGGGLSGQGGLLTAGSSALPRGQ